MEQYRKNLGKVSVSAEGLWDKAKSFDKLSIVYDEITEHAFLSKQEVPAGIDLHDSRYWMPLNVSGYSDSNIIIFTDKDENQIIKSYTLEDAIKSITSVGRKPGCIISFYNNNIDREGLTGRWEIWQFNGLNVYDWENINNWTNIYYNYNKFLGWFANEDFLKKTCPFPEIGCYAYVGGLLNDAFVYRCDNKHVWINTGINSKDYVKVIVDGNVTIGENGNWFSNGNDTGIKANIKGDNGKTPIFRNNNNIIEYSYDELTWYPISEEINAWFRWSNDNKIQITRDNISWGDLSPSFEINNRIQAYVDSVSQLPNGKPVGTVYGVKDSTHTNENPKYRVYVYTTSGWIDNGIFNGISAGVVNDLTTGGADKALSAEMGKALFEDIHGREGDIVTIPHTAIVNNAWTNTALDTPVNVGSTITSVYKNGVRLDTGTIYYISSSNESFSFGIASLPLFLETRNIVSIKTDSTGTYVLNEEQEQPSIDGIMQKIDNVDEAVDGKESLTNKATDLSSPNNTSYPTTKAVADAIAIAAEGNSYKKVDVPEGFIIYIPKDEKRVYSGVNILAMANVLDLVNIVRGSRINDSGEVITDNTEGYITTYIPFKQNMWLLSNINNLVDNVYYYDKNYTFIKRKGSAISNAGKGSQITEDVSFIRFQIRLATLDSATNPQILMHDGSTTPSMVYKAYRFNNDGEVYQGEENFIWADRFNQFSYTQLIQGDNIDRMMLFDDMSLWEPSQVDSGYSNPSEGYGQNTKRADWTAENKYLYYDFLEHYYDGYLGETEGYRVTRRSLCQDSAHTGHEIFEYDFCPINYQYVVMLSAGMNADETQGIWGLATFIRCLMNEEEPMLAIAKKNIRFKVIPIVNASGFDKDLLSYYYSNGVNPNYNFNYKDSWSKQTKAGKGDYPDSNIETQALKAWINENANKAVWWHDLHTGTFGDTLNCIVMDLRFPKLEIYGNLNDTIAQSVCDYYKEKGYVDKSKTKWDTGYAQSLSLTNYDYAKHWYAYYICGIPNCMSEMHIESTGYGADGRTNNSAEGIKAYVLQIRILMMFMVNKYIKEHPKMILQDNKIGKVQQMFD